MTNFLDVGGWTGERLWRTGQAAAGGTIGTVATGAVAATVLPGDGRRLRGVVAVGDSRQGLFYSALEADAEAPTALLPLARLDVGEEPSLALLPIPGGNDTALAVMAVHSHAFCWNGVVINKRPAPALCDSVPKPSHYGLGYNFGTWEAWKQHVQQGSPLSACDDTIFAGAYDGGFHPSVALYSDGRSLGVAAVHEGLSPFHLPPAHVDCGFPLPHEGLVLDAWRLPQPMS